MADSDSRFTHRAARIWRWLAILAGVAFGLAGWWWLQRPMGSLVKVAEFGANPTQLEMHLYLPQRLAPEPAVLLALHWCEGSGPDFFANTKFAQLADQHGFIVIFPSVTRASRCWDVHSSAALTHGGSSDPQGLVTMVQFVVNQYHADSTRIFVTGYSSGGMMTQVLLGTHPDLFRAGAAFAGVPFGCFSGPTEWHEACATGKLTKSPEEWGTLVRNAYPGFTGNRPAVQLWHGTADDSLSFHNFGESIKQWTAVLETGATPVSTDTQTPTKGWTRYRYADASGEVRVEAFRGEGIPHNFKIPANEVIHFFGIDAQARTSPL